jgi:osmotically inducible protein OsmC
MRILYTAAATATGGGRDGKVRTSDGMIDTALATPVEMGGAGGATNPEQLFAAGYSGCFHNALRLVARRLKTTVDGSEVTAEVDLGSAGGGAFDLAVRLKVHLPGVDREQADRLVAAAHQLCPYSRATRGNIDVAVEIV